jgi:hypothetical protein
MSFMVDAAAPHLGGYIVGGDDATFFPELWTWLVAEHGVETMIDVGCGEGHAVDYFDTLGAESVGIDGVRQDHDGVYCHDYTAGPYTPPFTVDLCWCCEFVEHVEERYVPNFLATFVCADLVLMTHAEPGQQGHHHVNCQPAAYWRGVLAAVGYRLDADLTRKTRELAAHNTSPYNHYVRSGLAFARCRVTMGYSEP